MAEVLHNLKLILVFIFNLTEQRSLFNVYLTFKEGVFMTERFTLFGFSLKRQTMFFEQTVKKKKRFW